MIPLQCFALEENRNYYAEYKTRYHLLYYLLLYKREWSFVDVRANAVGGDEKRVLEQCHAPTDEHDYHYRCVLLDEAHLLEFEVAIPGECHETVGDYQQQDCE